MKNLDDAKAEILKINQFLEGLVPEIRSQVYSQLSGISVTKVDASDTIRRAVSPVDALEFFSDRQTKRPSETALLITAYWYSKYGTASFTKEWVEGVAERVGLTIPARVDMTFRGAQRDGKRLFRVRSARFSLTVHGEIWMQNQFDVKKGISEPPDEGAA